ncbi:hypothetical protein PROFUN_09090 [Planoprotostelium fungivorum]|uniref:Uncharacterized protein n=1 Tax=Planoprotostelium fungivorum TaxID=1890364 RepID=A0A2P6NIH2_9EUKA|nr:hypothetical protein PROFUN_09090 [Planoprotostelium fungivorum]
MSSLLSLLPGKEFSVSGVVGGVVKDWFSHSSVANYIKQSYMIQMSLLVGIAGGMLAITRKQIDLMVRRFGYNFVVSVSIDSRDDSYNWMLEWLSRHPYSETASNLGLMTIYDADHGEEEADNPRPKLIISPFLGNHFLRYKNHFFWVQRERDLAANDISKGGFYERINFTLLGRNKQVMQDLISDALDMAYKKEEGKLIIFVNKGGQWKRFGIPRKPRSLSSVILESRVKDSVVDDVREFLESRQWYIDMGIPFRRGYLLYGFPGTGKSSFITALAGEMKMKLCIVSLNEKGMNDEQLHRLLNSAPPFSFILLEDIDAAFRKRNKNDTMVTFGGLLNALDGAGAMEGKIVFMTTNRIHLLDRALIRPGRIDMRVPFNLSTSEQITTMFLKFFPDASEEVVATFNSKIPENTISMAELQAYLQKRKKYIIRAIDEWVEKKKRTREAELQEISTPSSMEIAKEHISYGPWHPFAHNPTVTSLKRQVILSTSPTALLINCLVSRPAAKGDDSIRFGVIGEPGDLYDLKRLIEGDSQPSTVIDKRGAEDDMKAMEWSPDGKLLITAYSNHIEIRKGNEPNESMKQFNLRYTPKDVALTLIPNYAYILAIAGPNGVEMYSLPAGVEELTQMNFHKIALLHESSSITRVSFSADGSLLAVAALDGHISVWKTEVAIDERISQQFWFEYIETGRITEISFSSDGQMLAVGMWNDTIKRFHRTSKGQWEAYLPRYSSSINSITSLRSTSPPTLCCWSPNSHFLIDRNTVSGNTDVMATEARTGRVLSVYRFDAPVKGMTVCDGVLMVYDRNCKLYYECLPNACVGQLTEADPVLLYSRKGTSLRLNRTGESMQIRRTDDLQELHDVTFLKRLSCKVIRHPTLRELNWEPAVDVCGGQACICEENVLYSADARGNWLTFITKRDITFVLCLSDVVVAVVLSNGSLLIAQTVPPKKLFESESRSVPPWRNGSAFGFEPKGCGFKPHGWRSNFLHCCGLVSVCLGTFQRRGFYRGLLLVRTDFTHD